LERGDLPNLIHLSFQQISEGWKKNPVCIKGINHGTNDNFLILDKTLLPYLKGYKVKDITSEIVKQFHEFRESRGIRKSTLEKERRVLKWVMQSVSKSWTLPHWEFNNPSKEKEDAPRFEQVALMIQALPECSREFGKEYQDVAWVMVYTGLDTSDALNLSRSSIKDGLLVGKRGKTGKRFKVAISKELNAILVRRKKERKVEPASLHASFFEVPGAKAVSHAIGRAFKKIGLERFHAKSLRDFYASVLFNGGFSDNFIQDALGHVRGSSETRKYTIASPEKLKEAAGLFDSLSILKKEANQK
jgi:integrase